MNEHAGHRNRLRESFIQNGVEGMADHQVLELLLTYALPRMDVNPLAHRLLARFGSLEAAKRSYGYRTRGKGLASACVNCGQCLSVCPQHIESAIHMARAAELFE